MALEMRKTSQWWYGRWKAKNKSYCKNLNVKIAGERPRSLSQKGDTNFEKSRAKAEGALQRLRDESKRKAHAEDLVQTLHEIRTGENIGSIALSDLVDAWENIQRPRQPSQQYIQDSRSKLNRFQEFMYEKYPSAQEMADVTHQMAQAFLKAEQKRGVSGKTWNDTLMLLRSAFRHLRREAGIAENPFEEIRTTAKDTIFRKPFTPQDLKAILEAAQKDDFMRPIFITGICTAMRRGDCCCLKWSSIDLNSRFVTVKTSKTGETVDIPMFPLFYDEILRIKRGESQYVFPEQAEKYMKSPVVISQRIRKVLATAGFTDNCGKKESEINYRGEIYAERENGLRRVSIRDFHSFRVSWITLALTAGVPLEIVRKVTGHRTVETVLTHYFRPGREDFRHTLQSAMPKLLMNGSLTKEEHMRRIIERMTMNTLERDRKKLLALLPKRDSK